MVKFFIRIALLVIVLHTALTPVSSSLSDKPRDQIVVAKKEDPAELARKEFASQIKSYLEGKKSPLAEKTDYLLTKKHWKLLIAISAIESQWCTRKLYLNCWGIGGDYAYRRYATLEEGIDDADALISRWQAKGKWLTVESMNGSYVVPRNPTWVRTVNSVIKDLNAIARRTMGSGALDDSGAHSER